MMKKAFFITIRRIALLAIEAMLVSCGAGVPTQVSPKATEANITCNDLSFYLDPALGSSGKCVMVPENASSDIPMYYVFIYPGHTELTIEDYPLTGTQFPPQIWIYPVDRFSVLLPDKLPARISALKRIISDGIPGSGVMPFLPMNPQVQSFFLHPAVISFHNGKGVRFITEYSDGPLPISNKNLVYTFQGLTDDGKCWVAVTLPIGSPILPANSEKLPEGYTRERMILGYNAYVNEVKAALEAQPLDSFTPAMESLDNLVRSITVKP